MLPLPRVSLILAFGAAGLAAGCGGSASPSVTPSLENGAAWSDVQSAREDDYRDYIADNDDGMEAFSDPAGFTGMPSIMFLVFPDVFPDLWPEDTWAAELGLFWTDTDLPLLPDGLASGMGSTPLIDFPGLSNIRMRVTNLSCSACHTGRVEVDGQIVSYPGAPSVTADANRFRNKLYETVNDPRFTFENFEAAIDAYDVGDLYGGSWPYAQENLDRTVFGSKGADILPVLIAKVSEGEERVHATLGANAYGDDAWLLNGYTPGRVDAFGAGAVKLLPESVTSLEGAALTAASAAYFAPQAGLVDVASVWNQRTRTATNWDGVITQSLFNALGAMLAFTGDADLVDYDNAVEIADLIDDLPSPPYPFDVDTTDFAAGKQVFNQACASCHSAGGELRDAAETGTDDGRTLTVTPIMRTIFTDEVRESCTGWFDDRCDSHDDDITTPVDPDGAYLAMPLDGVWARAPFLHNGSVPTLYHLLVPSERPETFARGSLAYDQELLGFAWQGGPSTYDTTLPGMSNSGHDDPEIHFGGFDFTVDAAARNALLTYLATL